jgi:hypothetical protein
MSHIYNVETILQLHHLRNTVSGDLSDLVALTPSMKYAETTAIQAGYQRSGPLKITGGNTVSIRVLLEFQEEGNPMRIAENDKLLAKYGFARGDQMLMGFDVDFPVGSIR